MEEVSIQEPLVSPLIVEIKPTKRKQSLPIKKQIKEITTVVRKGGKAALQRQFTSEGSKKQKKTTLINQSQGGIRKPRRFKPGTVALREIRQLQRTVTPIIPRQAFLRLVKEIAQQTFRNEYRFQSSAIDALREASEAYISGIMEDTNLIAIHSKRVTIMKKDLILAQRIRAQ